MSVVDYAYWDGKQFTVREDDDYIPDLHHALSFLHNGMTEQGYNVYSVTEVIRNAVPEMMLAVTPTAVIGFNIESPWFSPDSFLGECFIGPRIGCVVDMADAVECLSAIARQAGCTHVCLGTRSNHRHAALDRLLERTGCRVSTIELIREVSPCAKRSARRSRRPPT